MPGIILIIEDNESWTSIYQAVLDKGSYHILFSSNYVQAIEELETNLIDLVLLDLRLEGEDQNNLDGIKLIEYINRYHPDVKVVVNTGYPEILTKSDALQHFNLHGCFSKGVDNEFTYAFTPELLLESVEKVMRSKYYG